MPSERLAVAGLRNEDDAAKVRHALKEVWGIQEVAVDAARGEVTFSYDERAASAEDFRQAIRSEGFEVRGVQ